jgi:hypothetical protein
VTVYNTLITTEVESIVIHQAELARVLFGRLSLIFKAKNVSVV